MRIPDTFRRAACAGITCSDGERIGVRFVTASGDKCYLNITVEDARFLALALVGNIAVGDYLRSVQQARSSGTDSSVGSPHEGQAV